MYKVIAAYVIVIIIWSTTPLTIKWSSEGVGFLFSILARMSIGCVLAITLVFVKYKKLDFTARARRTYLAAALAIYGGMIPVYWGAQFVSSGVISVLFGITPMITGYFAFHFLHENSFSALKKIGAMLGILGLVIIFFRDAEFNEGYAAGVSAILIAVLLHSISAVWVKSIKSELPALSVVAGGLLFAMPFFIVTYIVFAPALPDMLPNKSLISIVYLGVVGSVIGFMCYYYLLKTIKASSVALITLITPVCALYIGHVINNEVIDRNIYYGSVLILIGLIVHQKKGGIFNKNEK